MMAFIPNNTNVFKALKETGDNHLEIPAGDLGKLSKIELLAATAADVQSAAKSAKRELLQSTVENTLTDKFVN